MKGVWIHGWTDLRRQHVVLDKESHTEQREEAGGLARKLSQSWAVLMEMEGHSKVTFRDGFSWILRDFMKVIWKEYDNGRETRSQRMLKYI